MNHSKFTRSSALITTILAVIVNCGGESDSDGDGSVLINSTLLPTATITVDGDASDWSAIDKIIVDPIGDQQGNISTDLVSVRVARSGTKLALLMETAGNIVLRHSPTQAYSHYEIGIHIFTDNKCTNELGFYIVNNFTDSSGETFNSLDNYIDGGNFNTIYAYQTNFLETAFDLSLLPTGKFYLGFNPFIQSFSDSGVATMHDDTDDGVNTCYELPQ